MSHAGLGLREEPLDKGALGAWDLGFSINHLSSFVNYTFNTKVFTYHTCRKQDQTVEYEPSDRRYEIGVNGLGYSNSYRAKVEVIVRKLWVTCCKYHRERRAL